MATVSPGELKTASPFSDLFPINPATRTGITESMRRDGYDLSRPINVWRERNVVVDGHTRREVALALGLDVSVCFHDFADEQAALEYAIASQKNRRNLTDADIARCVVALDKTKAKGGDRGNQHTGGKLPIASGDVIGRSSQVTAEVVGTSSAKVEKVRTIERQATPEVKAAVAGGTMTINRAYRETRKAAPPKPTTKNSAPYRKPTPVVPKPLPKATVDAVLAGPPDTKTTEDEAWLSTLYLRRVVGNNIDDDARLWREFSGDIARIKARMTEMMGHKSDSYMGPLSLALARLTSVGPPSDWITCPKCEGVESRRVVCDRCRRRGFAIPGLK